MKLEDVDSALRKAREAPFRTIALFLILATTAVTMAYLTSYAKKKAELDADIPKALITGRATAEVESSSEYITVLIKTDEPIPDAEITVAVVNTSFERSMMTSYSRETVVQVPADFEGQEIKVTMIIPGFAGAVERAILKEGAVVDFGNIFGFFSGESENSGSPDTE